ncbi:DNA primase [Plantactinospora sp. BB1]|nr:DNA primase [Plantactinospora sp. BB1]
MFLPGPRCPQHTPAAIAGRTTPDEGSNLVSDLLTTARAHAARGWHVFPLRPDDKRPAVRDWESRATTDPDRIERCWTAGPYGIGIACGPSRLVVVDLDVPKTPGGPNGAEVFGALCEPHGPDAWETYTVQTGRGGLHLYYRHPDGPELRNTAGTLGPAIDTRAHGGYVVAAGSTVAGRPYLVDGDTDPAPLPGWLADLLRPAPLPPQRPVVVALPGGREGAYVRAAIDRETARVATAPEGQRNRSLYVAAVALGQLVAGAALAEDQATSVLEHAGLSAGLGRVEIARTVRSGIAAGQRRPRAVAA